MAAADSARNRAQAGYGIASGIASALVLAGAFASIEDRGLEAQILAGVAFLAWVVTAGLFLRAVATPATVRAEEIAEDADSPEWVERILTRAQSERVAIDRRSDRAVNSGLLAIALTFVTVLVTAGSGLNLDKDQVVVSLTAEGRKTIAELCNLKPHVIRGELESRTLRRDFVVVTTEEGQCNESEATLRIPKEQIAGIGSP